jgi:hypothetical protein
MYQVIQFDGECPFCRLSCAEWGWCLHCERIYPAVKWRANKWKCPDPDCDGGHEDAFPFPPTPRCENCVPPLDYRPTGLTEGQYFPLWQRATPLHRMLLASSAALIRRIAKAQKPKAVRPPS